MLDVLSDNAKSIIANFLVGGSVVASVSVLATWLNPVAGAIWWSFPFTIIPSVYFMRSHGRSNQDVSAFLLSSTFAFVLLLLAIYAMSYYFDQLKPHDPFWWTALAKATGVWFICAVIFYYGYTAVRPVR